MLKGTYTASEGQDCRQNGRLRLNGREVQSPSLHTGWNYFADGVLSRPKFIHPGKEDNRQKGESERWKKGCCPPLFPGFSGYRIPPKRG
jgi:hypothetical protein